MSPVQLKFSLDLFRQIDLPNLLINIWDYADKKHSDCSVCKQYSEWCVMIAKEKWTRFLKDFDFAIGNMKKQNKKCFDVGKLLPATRSNIYLAICKTFVKSLITG